MSNALLMVSLTTIFSDADEAFTQLDRCLALAQQIGNRALADAGNSFRAWLLAVNREYEAAIAVARQVTRSFDEIPTNADNPAYNAAGVIAVCKRHQRSTTGTDLDEQNPKFSRRLIILGRATAGARVSKPPTATTPPVHAPAWGSSSD